jgi:hypothetical protein
MKSRHKSFILNTLRKYRGRGGPHGQKEKGALELESRLLKPLPEIYGLLAVWGVPAVGIDGASR